MTQLQELDSNVTNLSQGTCLGNRLQTLMDNASLAYSYWRQRIKDQHIKLGDLPSLFSV